MPTSAGPLHKGGGRIGVRTDETGEGPGLDTGEPEPHWSQPRAVLVPSHLAARPAAFQPPQL